MRSAHPRPLVSVVIPTRDRPDALRRTVESVVAQTYENLEVIVVNNGGSSVEAILSGLDARAQVVLVQLPAPRSNDIASERGRRIACGECVTVLEAGEVLEPNRLEAMVEARLLGGSLGESLPPDDRIDVTIAIPFEHEPAAHVRGFLARLARVTEGVRAEVLVADRGLSEDARAAAVAGGAQVLPTPGVLPRALDVAARAARGRYLAVVRSDVLLEEGWLDSLLATALQNGGETTIAGGKTLTPSGKVEHAGLEFRQLDGTPRALFRGLAATTSDLDHVRPLEATAAAAVLLPIGVTRGVGFGTIDGWSCLADLCLRARPAGITTVFAPRSIAYRVPRKEPTPWLASEHEADLAAAARAMFDAVKDPELARARVALGEGRVDEAAQAIDAVVPKDRASQTEALLLRGVEHIERGEFDAAVDVLERAASGGAESYTARLSLGITYLGLGDPEKAWHALLPLTRKHPEDDVVAHEVYRAGLATGRWAELADILERYVGHCPNDHEKRYALASVALRAGRPEFARRHIDVLRANVPQLVGLEQLEKRLARAAA